MLAPLGVASVLARESVPGTDIASDLPLLLQGMPAGAFLALACGAAARYASSRAWPYAWLCLAALAAGGYQFTLGQHGVAGLFPATQRGSALAEPLAGSALVLCFTGFLCSLARREPACYPYIRWAAIGTTALVILNFSALWLAHTTGQLALLLAAAACACFAVLCMMHRGRAAMAGLLGATALAALLQLLLRLDGVDMFMPQPTGTDGLLRPSATEYVLTALVNLTLLALWLRQAGEPRAGPPAAKGRARENLRVGREVARQTMALSLALARAQDQNQQKVRTLGYVAHDLRAPLATILGYVRLLRGSGQPPRAEHLDAIERSAVFQLALIDDVLEYAKTELAPLHLSPASTRLPELLDQIVPYASMLSRLDNNRFVYAPPPHLPACVQADGRRLQQVLLNLLANATKFTPGGTISLIVQARREAEPPRWRMRFCVEDEGVGIAPAQQATIFDAFTQLERERGGAGLGLYIAARIVEGMGGELAVSSVPGTGSAFSFEIDLPELDGTLVVTHPSQPGGPVRPPLAALPAPYRVPPLPARRELARLARDGRLTDIEEWLPRAMQLHPDFDDYYNEVRAALRTLDLARLEALALQEAEPDGPP